jgi:prepilin-type N-terminal cleavage/methylation domain-containing protein
MIRRAFPLMPAVSKRAFTLVELLVVIGIIALLIAILLPALNAAREQAKTVQCASNMRQLAISLVNYATEYKGKFPPNINTVEPTPPAGQPTAHYWYDVDRLGRFLPKGVQPSATSSNPTIGGTILKCPNDIDDVQRSYAMNIWASSTSDYYNLNYGAGAMTYGNHAYVAPNPPRGAFFGPKSKGGPQLILLVEAHARNFAGGAGWYANSTVGIVPGNPDDAFPGRRFLGLGGGYSVGQFGATYPANQANSQIAWFKHRDKKDKGKPASMSVGRVNFAFSDAHVEALSTADCADETTKLSKLRALWSPIDKDINK